MGILCKTGGSRHLNILGCLKNGLQRGGVPDTPGTPSPPARPLISEALSRRSKTP